MIININEMKSSCLSINEAISLDLSSIQEAYSLAEPSVIVKVNGEVKKPEIETGILIFTAKLCAELKFYCSRCLKPVGYTQDIVVTEYFSATHVDVNDLDMEYCSIEDGNINIDHVVYVNIINSLPMRVLCGEDCKGLCPCCGKNMNEENCDCDKNNTDPRFDVLKSLFNNE